MLENGTTYTGIAFPDSKYYNLYTESSYIGHALTETKNWYSDYAYFVNAGYPWFLRGADRSDGASAGVFAFNGTIGDSYTYYSSRLVISNEQPTGVFIGKKLKTQNERSRNDIN